MSGETEEQPSAWTVDMLAQYVNRMLAEHDRRYEQRFVAQETATTTAFVAQEKATTTALAAAEKAVTAALAASDKAVAKAEAANEKRLDAVNEFRGQLSDQATTFMPRLEYEARHAALLDKVTDVITRMDKTEGRGAGVSLATGVIVAALGVAIGIVAIVVSIVLN